MNFSNLKKYYLWHLVSLNVFITPIYVIYLQQAGFSYLQISLFHLLKDFSIIILEVPSGIISDLTRRKNVMLISACSLTAAMLLFAFYANNISIAAAFVFWGAAIAFASGSEEAIIFENLENKEEYSRIASNASVIKRVGGFFTKALGPIFFALHHVIPFLFSAFLGVIGVLVAGSFQEKNGEHSSQLNASYLKKVGNELKHGPVFFSILSFAITMGLINTIFIYQQPKLAELGINPVYFSIIYGAFFGAGALGSFLARFLQKRFNYFQLHLMTGFIGGLSIIVMGASASLIIVGSAMLAQSLVHGLLYPTQNMIINKHIQDKNRAGILSVQSLTQSGVKALCGLSIGFLADTYGLSNAVYFTGLFSIGFFILWFSSTFKRQRRMFAEVHHIPSERTA